MVVFFSTIKGLGNAVACSRLYGYFKGNHTQQKLLRSKQMAAWFFAKTDHLATVLQKEHKTVNYQWVMYHICLPEVFGDINKTNKRRQIILHHDSATHESFATHSWFGTKWFLLFPNVNKKLRAQRFLLVEEVVVVFKNQVELKKNVVRWFESM